MPIYLDEYSFNNAIEEEIDLLEAIYIGAIQA